MDIPAEDPLELWLEEIFDQSEDTFLSLIYSPMFSEYAGISRQLSEEDLRALYGLMRTSLRQTRMNLEDQFASSIELLGEDHTGSAGQLKTAKTATVSLPTG